ncbi:hypothetical protein CEXT_593511 [Caerostris extrusa]|uniref:Uncharacterized protein n=1 Tax=Caerostris extrusa TaxID=172846 RepID=A0AAV4PJF6_CAEEX|nr:hypothetical protein CEXT_593511 [Caerostris extrusa]
MPLIDLQKLERLIPGQNRLNVSWRESPTACRGVFCSARTIDADVLRRVESFTSFRFMMPYSEDRKVEIASLPTLMPASKWHRISASQLI